MATSSDSYSDFPCGFCGRENRNVEAEKFCMDCEDYLCGECISLHKKFPLLRSHKLETISKAETFRQDSVGKIRNECPTHRGEYLQTFCADHDAICCNTCVSVGHRTCENVVYLPDAAKGVASSEELRNVLDNAKTAKDSLTSLISSGKEVKTAIEKETKDAIENVKNYRQQMNAELDRMEKETLRSLEDEKCAVISKITGFIEKCEKNQLTIDEHIGKLSSRGVDDVQLFISLLRTNELCENIDCYDEQLSDDIQDRDIFRIKPWLKTILKKFSKTDNFRDTGDSSSDDNSTEDEDEDEDSAKGEDSV